MEPTILQMPDRSQTHFSITTDDPTEGQVTVTCHGLGGNLPERYGNNLALWGSSLPNLASDPLKVIQLPNNNQPNRVVFPYKFEPTDYCLTYQVGPEPSTMAALAFLPLFPAAALAVPTHVSMTILNATPTTLKLRYTTLPGCQPSKSGSWIGLWGGYTVPYSAGPPLGRMCIPSDQAQGEVVLGDLDLRSSLTYTLTFFMQPSKTTAASSLYFSL